MHTGFELKIFRSVTTDIRSIPISDILEIGCGIYFSGRQGVISGVRCGGMRGAVGGNKISTEAALPQVVNPVSLFD